jgi:hypothetical protein
MIKLTRSVLWGGLILVCAGGLGSVLWAQTAQPAPTKGGEQTAKSDSAKAPFPSAYVGARGEISFPADYRLKWTHLGSWSLEDPDAKLGFHDVYTQAESVLAFQKTGKWPNGTVIVKEVRGARKGKMTTGEARWDAEIQVWFVMVKDTENAFPDNPNWGRGWGWALFNADDHTKNVSTNFKLDCIACHVPAQKTDWVYQHGYPILNEKDGPFKKYVKEIYDGEAQSKAP